MDQSYRGGSPEVARLLAWIDAVMSHEREDSVEAAIETAQLREQAAAEGWFTEAARLLAEQASPELRAAFADKANSLNLILGVWEADAGWHVGMAGLTYEESKATRLSLNGLEDWEIAKHDDMLSKRRRRMGETVPVATVYHYLWTSALKLHQLFGTTSEILNPPEPNVE